MRIVSVSAAVAALLVSFSGRTIAEPKVIDFSVLSLLADDLNQAWKMKGFDFLRIVSFTAQGRIESPLAGDILGDITIECGPKKQVTIHGILSADPDVSADSALQYQQKNLAPMGMAESITIFATQNLEESFGAFVAMNVVATCLRAPMYPAMQYVSLGLWSSPADLFAWSWHPVTKERFEALKAELK